MHLILPIASYGLLIQKPFRSPSVLPLFFLLYPIFFQVSIIFKSKYIDKEEILQSWKTQFVYKGSFQRLLKLSFLKLSFFLNIGDASTNLRSSGILRSSRIQLFWLEYHYFQFLVLVSGELLLFKSLVPEWMIIVSGFCSRVGII